MKRTLEQRCKSLQAIGLSYKDIAWQVGVEYHKVWRLLNRERYLATVADSQRSYRRRGNVAIVDMTPEQWERHWRSQLS